LNRDPCARRGLRERVTAAILVVAGGTLLTGSALRLVGFVSRLDQHPQLSPAAVLRLLVMPHVLMLTGAGMLLAGLLLLGRKMLERMRR